MCVFRGVSSSFFDLTLRSRGRSASDLTRGVLEFALDRSNGSSSLDAELFLLSVGAGDLLLSLGNSPASKIGCSDLTGVEVLSSEIGIGDRDFSGFFSLPCSESRSDPVVSRSLAELTSDESEHSDPSRLSSGVSIVSLEANFEPTVPLGNLASGIIGGVMAIGCPGGNTGNPGAPRGG